MSQISDFDPTFRQRLAIKWYLRDEGLLLQCLIGIVYVFKRVMNTPSMIVGPSLILLQPLVGRFHVLDLNFRPTFWQRLAIKWYPRDVGLLLQCLINIVYVFKRVMNTPSMIVGPSIILLQPLVGRFHASDLNSRPTFWQCLAIKWYLRDEGLLLQCLIGIVYICLKE